MLEQLKSVVRPSGEIPQSVMTGKDESLFNFNEFPDGSKGGLRPYDDRSVISRVAHPRIIRVSGEPIGELSKHLIFDKFSYPKGSPPIPSITVNSPNQPVALDYYGMDKSMSKRRDSLFRPKLDCNTEVFGSSKDIRRHGSPLLLAHSPVKAYPTQSEDLSTRIEEIFLDVKEGIQPLEEIRQHGTKPQPADSMDWHYSVEEAKEEYCTGGSDPRPSIRRPDSPSVKEELEDWLGAKGPAPAIAGWSGSLPHLTISPRQSPLEWTESNSR